MGLTGRLYRLQQVDLELQRKLRELTEIENQLADNKAVLAAQSKLASQKAQLEEARRKQKSCEWELEDLQNKIKQINNKLFSGKTTNPKELVNLEKEIEGLKKQVKLKEDILLGLMSEMEEMEIKVRTAAQEVERLMQEWEQKQRILSPRKREIETLLAEFEEERSGLVRQIDTKLLKIYERLKQASGQAVAKVERGKCQGCHITIPMSQWQRAKAGDLIQCGSCSRILYVE